jgi:hypothetical protein
MQQNQKDFLINILNNTLSLLDLSFYEQRELNEYEVEKLVDDITLVGSIILSKDGKLTSDNIASSNYIYEYEKIRELIIKNIKDISLDEIVVEENFDELINIILFIEKEFSGNLLNAFYLKIDDDEIIADQKDELLKRVEILYDHDKDVKKYLKFIEGEDVDCDADLLLTYITNEEDVFILNANPKTLSSKLDVYALNENKYPEDMDLAIEITDFITPEDDNLNRFFRECLVNVLFIKDIYSLNITDSKSKKDLGSFYYDFTNKKEEVYINSNDKDISLLFIELLKNIKKWRF